MLSAELYTTNTMAKYFDVGVNLGDKMFRGVYHGRAHHVADVTAVLARARAFGVERVLLTGSSLEDSKEAIDWAATHQQRAAELETADSSEGTVASALPWPKLYTTVGVHPCTVGEFDPNPETHLEELRKLVHHGVSLGLVRAFGEIGLDYDRLHYTPRDTQLRYFALQLQLACEFELPLFLHMRAACDDFAEMLTPFLTGEGGHRLRNRNLLVHSFTGPPAELATLLGLERHGCKVYVSVNGAGLRDPHSFDTVRAIPLDRLMLETDAPWCEIKRTHASYALLSRAPNPFCSKEWPAPVPTTKQTPLTMHELVPLPIVKSERLDSFAHTQNFPLGPLVKSRNEPCLIGLVAQAVAVARGEKPHEVLRACYTNAMEVFAPEVPPDSHTAPAG